MEFLIEKMDMKINPLFVSGTMSERDTKLSNLAWPEFIQKLKHRQEGTKESVLEVFEVLDSLNEEYRTINPVPCGKGCSLCCHQLVTCSKLEMDIILDYLISLPKITRRGIKKRVKKQSLKFAKFLRGRFTEEDYVKRNREVDLILQDHFKHDPCVYLSAVNSCLIYEVRPVDCRIAKVKKRCSADTKPEQIRLFCDHIASTLIMDEEEINSGFLWLSHLIIWPLVDEYKKYFF
jgi:hypothetical protein